MSSINQNSVSSILKKYHPKKFAEAPAKGTLTPHSLSIEAARNAQKTVESIPASTELKAFIRKEAGGFVDTVTVDRITGSLKIVASVAPSLLEEYAKNARLPDKTLLGRAPDFLQVGIFRYPLQRPLDLIFSEKNEKVHCRDALLKGAIYGIGSTRADAQQQWARRIHFTFQRLARLDSFMQTSAQKELWEGLCKLIDVSRYEANRNLPSREIGQILSLPADAVELAQEGAIDTWSVRWFNEEKEEQIAIDQVPAEFCRYEPGQWFEAIVRRDPQTNLVKRIIFAEIRRPYSPISEEALRQSIAKHIHPADEMYSAEGKTNS